jgi:glucosylceramidase
MMRKIITISPVFLLIIALFLASCASKKEVMIEVYETSAAGHKLTPLEIFSKGEIVSEINLNPKEKRQVITGFGGAFTESSAFVLNQLSPKKKGPNNQCLFF